MCGLAGYITKKDTALGVLGKEKRRKIFNSLLISMETRGRDSTGVVGINASTHEIVKNTNKASDFTKFRRYKHLIDQDYPLVIGHTRFATVGKITQPNAHPFKFDNIVGTHNGHVSNYREVYPKGLVDSEAIFALLNKYNNDYERAFKELAGNFAVAWSDLSAKDYQLQLAREGNPVYLARVDELKTVFYTSTSYALKRALDEVDVKSEIFFMPEQYALTINSDLSEKFEKIKFMSAFDYYSKKDEEFGSESRFDYSGYCNFCDRFHEECICDNGIKDSRRGLPVCHSCLEALGDIAWGCTVEDEWLMLCGGCREAGGFGGERLSRQTIEECGLYAGDAF